MDTTYELGNRIEAPRAGPTHDVSRMHLASGAVASFEPCLPVQIHAIDGWLWITQEGDDRDAIVSPGNDFLSRRHGKLVVQTLEGATIEVRTLCKG